MMNELINKISSYNIFNYLLPGAIFVAFCQKITPYKIIQDNLLIDVFLIYFIGQIISRIGSLLIEPIFRKVVSFSDYEDFLTASKKDKKLEILSEVNNTYRTFISLFLSLFIIKIYSYCGLQNSYDIYIIIILLLILFICSYIKQTKYMIYRMEHFKEK